MRKEVLENGKKHELKVIARGEISDHSHIIIGDADVYTYNDEIFIDVKGECAIKHLIESAFIKGEEVWTNEHKDIKLDVGFYKYISQIEFDPYEQTIKQVTD